MTRLHRQSDIRLSDAGSGEWLPDRDHRPGQYEQGPHPGLRSSGHDLLRLELRSELGESVRLSGQRHLHRSEDRLPLFCPGDVTPCIPGPGHGNATVIRTRIPDVSNWTYNLVAMYEGPITARLSYNHRSSYPEGPFRSVMASSRCRAAAILSGRLDWSSSYDVDAQFHVVLRLDQHPEQPVQVGYRARELCGRRPGSPEIFPMVVRFEERVISGGIRVRFGGGPRPAPAPAGLPPAPPPPPPVQPAPEPAPTPPPPPAPAPERG